MPKRKKNVKKSKTTKKSRSSAQKSGFKKTKIPLDSGYVKPTKDGGRLHKRGPSSKIHKDKVDPARDPIGHIQKDVIGKRLKKKKSK